MKQTLTSDRGVGAGSAGMKDMGSFSGPWVGRIRISLEVGERDYRRGYRLVLEAGGVGVDAGGLLGSIELPTRSKRVFQDFICPATMSWPLLVGLVRVSGSGSSTFHHVEVGLESKGAVLGGVGSGVGLGEGWDDDPLDLGRVAVRAGL